MLQTQREILWGVCTVQHRTAPHHGGVEAAEYIRLRSVHRQGHQVEQEHVRAGGHLARAIVIVTVDEQEGIKKTNGRGAPFAKLRWGGRGWVGRGRRWSGGTGGRD